MITTTIKQGIATLLMDMPGRSMNVLTAEFAVALRTAFDAVIADKQVTGIIIASAKSAFMAGADLGQMAGFVQPGVTPAEALARIAVYGDLFRHIETAGKPVVAAASGTALGGGLELMLACHYRVAADVAKAVFGLPEVKLGLLPGAGGTQRVPRLIGLAASFSLLTKGTALSARAAQKIGLLHEVVAADQVLQAAETALREGRVSAVPAWDQKGYVLPGGDAYTPANIAAFTAANATVHVATRGNQPAPTTILSCIYEGTRLPMDKGLRLEQKYFVTLVQGAVAQNMMRTLFFARQSADKLSRRPKDVPASQVKVLGIVGAGFMGAGIAQASALAGISVVLLDRELAIAQKGRDSIAASLVVEVQKGRLTAEAGIAALACIKVAADYAALAPCDLVIEAVLEDFAVKAVVTRAAEAAMHGSAIYASNTSALPINDLAAASVRAENFIGLHFFSPVPKMALVEIIVGEKTSAETLARALDYVRQIRKTPIIVNDGYGFYTTRCVDAYVREGLRLLLDGVDPLLIEGAGLALGMPVGPLALGDEIGLDVLQHIAHFFRGQETGPWADDRHERVNRFIDQLMVSRRCGRKTAAGLYAYPEGQAKHLDFDYLASIARSAEQPGVDDVRERLLYAQVIEAARCWAEGVATDAGDSDLGAVLGWSFPVHLGGPMATIDALGAQTFVARADVLAAALGARFAVPDRLREFADSKQRFYA